MTIYDTTPTPPVDYDQSKVPEPIKRRADYVRTKYKGEDILEATAQNAEIAGIYAGEAKQLAERTQLRQGALETQTAQRVAQMQADKDAVIANATVDSEVILARGGKATLGDRLGSVDAKVNESREVLNRGFIGSMASFLADDTPLEDWLKLKPVSDATGIPFTLATITWENGLFDTSERHKLHTLVNDYGYEIASHTVSHQRLTELTEVEQDYELRESKRRLEEEGFNVTGIVYPYGSANEVTKKIAAKYYDVGYHAGTNNLNDSPVETYGVHRIQFDITNPNNNLSWYKTKVDEAIEKNQWIIFMVHSRVNTGTGDWLDEAQIEMMIDLIEYMQSINLPILTAGEAFKRYRNVYESSDGRYRLGAKLNNNTITSVNTLASGVVKSSTPLNNFNLGKTITVIPSEDATSFPEAVGGVLETNNFGTHLSQSYQEWKPYNSKNVYWRAWSPSTSAWHTFDKRGSHTFGGLTYTDALLPNDYPMRDVIVQPISTAIAQGSNLPTNLASVLTVEVTDVPGFVSRTLVDRDGKMFTQTGIENVWSPWRGSPDKFDIQTPATTIQANQVVDVTVSHPKADRLTAISASPVAGMTNGVMYVVLCEVIGQFKVRLYNTTGAQLTVPERTWRVGLI